MLGIIGMLTVGAGIVLIELPLLRKRGKKEVWVFCVTLALALGLGMAKSARVPIPNPLDWIAFVYKPVSDAVFRWLS
ncbi:MAG: hypothetical protein K0R28_777 [Paenibacillus sp.]|jgi:hypothetical protein|nr:hypothetical protein [Paenibacillus sp.]